MTNFEATYNKVFDSDGNMKACGREATKNLIANAQEINKDTDF